MYNRYNKLIKWIFILFTIIILFISYLSIFYKSKFIHTKNVCLCLIAKNENRYIKEFIEYYKNLGIDKIFLYDNNDINGEKYEDIIQNYIKLEYVDLIIYLALNI